MNPRALLPDRAGHNGCHLLVALANAGHQGITVYNLLIQEFPR